ncbi:MAG: ATP-binding cassette domain-containing protein [Patescibacteria group bacterium]
MISAQKINKRFGEVIALEDVSFEIENGEFVFLTGKSGSGKTTFLRLLLRELKPDSGELKTDIETKTLPEYRQQIGIVFQDFKLLTDRNVWENVALPLLIKGVKNEELHAAVHAAVETVDLTEKMELFPAQLSGGELQRVAIARAIIARPKLILADEPTGNLDPVTSKSIFKLLKQIHDELKTTIIMATHNADLVNHGALRVINLEKGKVTKDVAKGKYEEN